MNTSSRRFVLIGIVIVLVVVPIWFFLQPTLADRLEYFHGSWCIEQMQINGRDTIPFTHGVTLKFRDEGVCVGNMSFDDAVITFPGLNTFAGTAMWNVQEDKIKVWNGTPEAKIFEGVYTVKIKGEAIELRSDKVLIKAHVVKYRLPF